MSEDRERSISRNSRVTLGLAVLIVAAIVMNERRLSSIESKLATLSSGVVDRWTFAQQEAWSLRLAVNNPMLRVPDPANPGSTIQAGSGD
ncbi:MAG: hypothetical protein AAFR96_09385 [Planctomycetota bacterium]